MSQYVGKSVQSSKMARAIKNLETKEAKTAYNPPANPVAWQTWINPQDWKRRTYNPYTSDWEIIDWQWAIFTLLDSEAVIVQTDNNWDNWDYSQCFTVFRLIDNQTEVNIAEWDITLTDTNTTSSKTKAWAWNWIKVSISNLTADNWNVKISYTYNSVLYEKIFSISKSKQWVQWDTWDQWPPWNDWLDWEPWPEWPPWSDWQDWIDWIDASRVVTEISFSTDDEVTISWLDWTLWMDNTSYTTKAWNTWDMTWLGVLYIYFDSSTPPESWKIPLSITTDPANSVWFSKCLITVAYESWESWKLAPYKVLTWSWNNEIITADNIIASSLSSITANIWYITAWIIEWAIIRTASEWQRVELWTDEYISFYSDNPTNPDFWKIYAEYESQWDSEYLVIEWVIATWWIKLKWLTHINNGSDTNPYWWFVWWLNIDISWSWLPQYYFDAFVVWPEDWDDVLFLEWTVCLENELYLRSWSKIRFNTNWQSYIREYWWKLKFKDPDNASEYSLDDLAQWWSPDTYWSYSSWKIFPDYAIQMNEQILWFRNDWYTSIYSDWSWNLVFRDLYWWTRELYDLRYTLDPSTCVVDRYFRLPIGTDKYN